MEAFLSLPPLPFLLLTTEVTKLRAGREEPQEDSFLHTSYNTQALLFIYLNTFFFFLILAEESQIKEV